MTKKEIENILKTIYDPEFPIIDIFTLWLIYDYQIKKKEKKIYILMTLTSPMCPFGEQMEELIVKSIQKQFPQTSVEVELTFDPPWNPDMIKDKDIKNFFE